MGEFDWSILNFELATGLQCPHYPQSWQRTLILISLHFSSASWRMKATICLICLSCPLSPILLLQFDSHESKTT